MLRSIEAVVERDGRIRPLEDVRAPEGTHVIITFLPNGDEQNDTSLLSEPSLADWNRPEEEQAWAYLQKGRVVN